MADAAKDNSTNKRQRATIIILSVLLSISLMIGIWALFFRNTDPKDDYAPVALESNAEIIINDEQEEKMEYPVGGGALSLTYSKNVAVNLSSKTVSLLIGNPQKSRQDIVVKIVSDNVIIAQSGRITPGNQITRLSVTDEAVKKLTNGGIEGKIVILCYDSETQEKAMIDTEIPVTISVVN